MNPNQEPGPVKQVIVYRRDLNMRKGKIAAQCAHVALNVFLEQGTVEAGRMSFEWTPQMAQWVAEGHRKIVLTVDSEEDLLRLYELARASSLPVAKIVDLGHTEFHGVPTLTAVAIGPDLASVIDRITGPEGQIPTRLP